MQGIGLGVAAGLRRAGFRIALSDLADADSPKARAVLAQLGPDARYVRHDLADAEGAAGLLAAVEAAMGPVSALVQNAGVASRERGDMLEITPENFDFVMGVNLRGAFFVAQAAARRMLATPAAHYRSITFVTSVSAQMASVERADYCISKAGAAMAAQALALRLAPHGIGVVDLRPGVIDTAMTAEVRDSCTERIEGGLVSARRWGLPADIAFVVTPIATGHLAFATGAVIPVDGGLSIQRL